MPGGVHRHQANDWVVLGTKTAPIVEIHVLRCAPIGDQGIQVAVSVHVSCGDGGAHKPAPKVGELGLAAKPTGKGAISTWMIK